MKKKQTRTIKEKNYSAIKEALAKVKLDPAILAELLEVVEDHKSITDQVLAAIQRQEKAARKLLEKLKEEALAEAKSKEANETAGNISTDNDKINEVSSADDGTINPDIAIENIDQPKKSPAPLKPRRVIKHSLNSDQLKCPCCSKNMHRAHKKSVVILKFTGFAEDVHEIETARCLTCNTNVEATGPKEQSIGKFSIPLAAIFIFLRYVQGMPSFRLEEVTQSMGYRIPDSTQWDLFETAGNILHSFSKFLKATTAGAKVVQMDDTSVRINSLTHQFKLAANGGVEKIKGARTGVHTTGFIAKLPEGKVCFFESGLHHAGEVFEKIMKSNSIEDEVILMVDAASANLSKLKNLSLNVIVANCNSHARRKFDEHADNPLYKENIDLILAPYKEIFARDKELKNSSPEIRLKVHKEKSLPQMIEIRDRITNDFLDLKVEPNSPLGQTYKYFLNHFEKLCVFCKYLGAPICNNECERLLKRAIRHRKNSLFFKNLVGAAVGDIHMTILMTAKENGLEPVQYLADLLEFREHLKENPSAWLPWNYENTVAELRATKSIA